MTVSAPELVDLQTIKTNFAHGLVYFKNSENWPKETILLAHVNIKTSWGSDEIPWKKYYNKPGNKHAEIVLLEDLQGKWTSCWNILLELSLHLIMSYSPCDNCVDVLVKLKKDFEILGKKININIKFSNFYKGYRKDLLKKLADLDNEGIVIEVFNGLQDWKMFLNSKHISEKSMFFFETLKENRKERESVDVEILQSIFLYNEMRNKMKNFPCSKTVQQIEDMCLNAIGRSKNEQEATEYCNRSMAFFEAEFRQNLSTLFLELTMSDNTILPFRDFKDHFAVEAMYNTANTVWPQKTTMFCEFRLDNVNGNICSWMERYDGDCRKPGGHTIEYCMKVLRDNIKIRDIKSYNKLNLQIIASFSPCRSCVDEILKVNDVLKKYVEVNISIKFSNFYLFEIQDPLFQLAKLDRANIVIDVFYGFREWGEFLSRLRRFGQFDEQKFTESTITVKRKDRETVDKKILEIIFLYNQAIFTSKEYELQNILLHVSRSRDKQEVHSLLLKAAKYLNEALHDLQKH